VATQRLEVRLGAEHYRRLKHLAAERDEPLSEAIRRLIDDAYSAVDYARRRDAVIRLVAMEIEDVPDPDELSRQLEQAHDPGVY
jgi:macrodomain Ter protein organizer (MatP/YcbG family)